MRKILWALLVAIGLFLMWYLLLKKSEFEVNFKSNTLPGDIIQTVKIWNKSLENAQILDVNAYEGLSQMIVQHGRVYSYQWHFSAINDSTTQVKIEITEAGNSLSNKLLIPFTEQPIEIDANELIRNFYDILKEHLEITGVKIVGESETVASFCICATLESEQTDKALGMMKYYPPLSAFIDDNNLDAAGPPIIKILSWDHNLGRLQYNFCFPIQKVDNLPQFEMFEYKTFERQKALKAVYNGNYITSDRAWYAMEKYAESNSIEVSGLPIEVFYNNPNLGVNESEWKAEIYLPIK